MFASVSLHGRAAEGLLESLDNGNKFLRDDAITDATLGSCAKR
jgi:hypothetical protein